VNTLYFACRTCRIYVDAGYRHAYWELEDAGIVDRSNSVDVSLVLGAHDYWNVEAQWLKELLPAVRRFLVQHAEHGVTFGDIEDIPIPSPKDGLFDWLMEAGGVLEELPRYYVERLGFRTWDEVAEHVRRSKQRPTWWEDADERVAAQQRFASLVVESPPEKSSNGAV
jgi:hypothetical protein